MSEARHPEDLSGDTERRFLPPDVVAETHVVKVFSVGGLDDSIGQYSSTLEIYKRIFGEGMVFLADYEVDGVVKTGVALTDPDARAIISSDEAMALVLSSP